MTPMQEPTTCRVLTAGDAREWAALLADWQAFAARPDVRCGFWCRPEVLRAFEAGGGRGMFALAWVERGGAAVAAIPLRVERGPVPLFFGLWRVGSLRAVLLRVFDWEFAVCAGLSRAELLRAAAPAVGRALGADVLLGQNGRPEAGGGRGIGTWRNVQDTFLADLPADMEAYLAGLNPKSRQTLKRKVRRLEREAPGLACRCLRAPGEMPELHARLTAVWERSWHGRLGRQRPPSAEVLRELAQQGFVRAYLLAGGDGAPLASVLGYQCDGTFHDEAPAYDDRWAAWSPGLVLNCFIIEELLARDRPARVDFGFGFNQYKQVLGNRRERRGQLWIPLSARGRALVSLGRAGDACFAAARRVLAGSGLVRRIKRRVQGRGALRRVAEDGET